MVAPVIGYGGAGDLVTGDLVRAVRRHGAVEIPQSPKILASNHLHPYVLAASVARPQPSIVLYREWERAPRGRPQIEPKMKNTKRTEFSPQLIQNQ
jgi:hypothetical protein